MNVARLSSCLSFTATRPKSWLLGGLASTSRTNPRTSGSSSRPCLTNSFHSSNRQSAIAAPEIDFDKTKERENHNHNQRVVPASSSYFTVSPDFTDSLLSLEALVKRFQTLPALAPGHAPRVAWKTLAQYRNYIGEPVKASRYQKILQLLNRLNHIHPTLMPSEARQIMDIYKRDSNPYGVVRRQRTLDNYGRAVAAGRRKSSSAQVWLVEGDGEVLINGKTLPNAFPRLHDRESAIWALKATARIGKYNVWARVRGGGSTGQAEALTLAVGKALLVHEPLLKPALRRGEFVATPATLFAFHLLVHA
ncbi:MAG: hypothetical protein M1825_000015 [Sarcosagium campestre]|nr:MAG: hypothetical protein M1825_000015 [Sarcosagium campestre]